MSLGDALTGSVHPLGLHQSGARYQHHVTEWVNDAVGRGEKVFYKRRSQGALPERLATELGGAVPQALRSGQFEVLDAKQCHIDTAGDHTALYGWNLELMSRARREGYPRVAMVADGAALHEMAPDAAELLAHERDLNELTAAGDTRALCCYDTRAENDGLLTELAGLHYHHVRDLHWNAVLHDTQLWVAGEIDMSNAQRFAAVLHAAIAAGVRTVDLGGVDFFSAAGVRVLEAAALTVGKAGERLLLVNVPAVVNRTLAALDFATRTGTVISEGTVVQHVLSGPPDQPVDSIARQLTDLTGYLLDATSVADALQRIIDAGRRLVSGADVASVTLRDPDGVFHTPVHTDVISYELDELQYETGEGPCVESTVHPGPGMAVSADLAHESRWPRFGPAAAQRGVGAVLSVSLLYETRPPEQAGALNFYARSSHRFSDADRDAAVLLATHASLALASTLAVTNAELREAQLHKAIDSRDVIGQAKGILMDRRGIGAEAAFEILRKTSQELNVKLVDLAQTLASRHGELDLPDGGGEAGTRRTTPRRTTPRHGLVRELAVQEEP